jgi:NAD(P)-dependent dehydrogenase (short-subunit alcohol dehydrogenase family)
MSSNMTTIFDLKDRIAIVTGASSGIGASLARGLATAGARVVLAARRLERLQQLARDIEAAGGRALPLALDLGSPEAIAPFLDAIQAHFGGPANILVNNAGVAEPMRFLKTPRESLNRTLQTNFVAPWELTREFAARLVAAKTGGAVLNIGSVLGLGAANGYAAYSASKAALHQLTKSLALELVPVGIRVNAIAPGWFVTEMNQDYFASEAGRAYRAKLPPGRLGELPELLGPALLLVSGAGSYINGVVLPVDGGHAVALT